MDEIKDSDELAEKTEKALKMLYEFFKTNSIGPAVSTSAMTSLLLFQLANLGGEKKCREYVEGLSGLIDQAVKQGFVEEDLLK